MRSTAVVHKSGDFYEQSDRRDAGRGACSWRWRRRIGPIRHRRPPDLRCPRSKRRRSHSIVEGLGRDRAGALRFLAGWSLTSADPRFGGLSSLHVEGGWATAASDAGSLIRFRIPETPGAGQVHIAPIVQGPAPGTRKADRDAEALLVHGNDAWITFESPRQIWRYDRASWRAEAAARAARDAALGQQ